MISGFFGAMAPKLWKRAAGRFYDEAPRKQGDEEPGPGRGLGRLGSYGGDKEEPLGVGQYPDVNEEKELPQKPVLTANRFDQLDTAEDGKMETFAPVKGSFNEKCFVFLRIKAWI